MFFQQEEVHLGNQYVEDTLLCSILKHKVPPSVLTQWEDDLVRFGARVSPSGDTLELGRACERNPPRLVQYNAWGRRTDQILVDQCWNSLKDLSAEEGLVAIGYERKYGPWSRLYQYIKMYLFSYSCSMFHCPLGMTDGAARLLEVHGSRVSSPEHKEILQKAFMHLTSRDPAYFWTSGQWMTEKTGGSDVQPSETVAHEDPSTGMYLLSGLKFFTSATTSEMAITLARTKPGTPLSAFYLEVRDSEGNYNGITINKLKEKLGTRAVPTAELLLKNTKAIRIGGEGEGVRVISELFNITRILNACHSVAAARRAISLARDYATRRKVFGRLLSENPLHLSTLAQMEVEFRGCLHFVIDVVIRQGKLEVMQGEEEGLLLRLLTPVIKLYTAKKALDIVSEGIEAIGGTAYMEDSGIPVLLRDTQVTTIWEGTTNVLSMDLWRPLMKQRSFPLFKKVVMENLQNSLKDDYISKVQLAMGSLESFLREAMKNEKLRETKGREFAFSMARVYVASLMLEYAACTKSEVDLVAGHRFCDGGLIFLEVDFDIEEKIYYDKILAMDIDPHTGKSRATGELDATGKLRARY